MIGSLSLGRRWTILSVTGTFGHSHHSMMQELDTLRNN